MGGWKLEIFKMAIYMAFPVGLFYWFNQPQYFEEWIVAKRRLLFPPDDRAEVRKLKEFIKDYREAKEKEYFEALTKSK